MRKSLLALTSLAFITLFLISFQNCGLTGVDTGADNSLSSGIGSKGNGDSYEGKTQDFMALDRLNVCAQGPNFVASAISFDENGVAKIVRQNCVDIAPAPLASQDFLISPDAPEVLTMNGELYESADYLETAKDQTVWACRVNMQVKESANSARVTVRIFKSDMGEYTSVLTYAVYDPSEKLLSIRKTRSRAMDRIVNLTQIVYRDPKKGRGDLRLRIRPKTKLGEISFSFSRPPNWRKSKDSAETKDQDVQLPLGPYQSERVTCYGDEKLDP